MTRIVLAAFAATVALGLAAGPQAAPKTSKEPERPCVCGDTDAADGGTGGARPLHGLLMVADRPAAAPTAQPRT